jgi:6-phosphogluconolactonase
MSDKVFSDFLVEKSVHGLMPVLIHLENRIPKKPLVGVCGGSSIAPVLGALSSRLQTESAGSNFHNAHLMMIDERLVPADHADSNVRIVREGLGITDKNLPVSITEFNTGNPQQGIKEYDLLLRSSGGNFDVVFLGVGEDAHIAGLFPGFSWPEDGGSSFFTFSNSPKPPAERMSAAPHVIRGAKAVVVLFFGTGKQTAYGRFLKNEESVNECPVLLTRESPDLVVVRDIEG